MRVAVTQFATTVNPQENLVSCIRMINKTAVCQPTLIVLPEYRNTFPESCKHKQVEHSVLSSTCHFIQSMAEQAKKHGCYLVISMALQRDINADLQNDDIEAKLNVISCLFTPLGELIYQGELCHFIGQYHDVFMHKSKPSEVLTTPFGKLGLLHDQDTMTYQAPRNLALGGAQLLCNSIHSLWLDQSHLHDRARASENNVYVLTANNAASLNTHKGMGHSQIICPKGNVLAKLTHNEAGYVFADIDLIGAKACVGLERKYRVDGSQVFKQLRPELYQTLTQDIQKMSASKNTNCADNCIAKTANVAIFATYKRHEEAIDDVCHYIVNNLSDIIQLPELFFLSDKTLTHNTEKLNDIGTMSLRLISKISAVLRPQQYVCTSLVIKASHQAVLISNKGLLASQQQLHFCQRYQWTSLTDKINIIKLPLEQGNITLAMLTGDDAYIPEIVHLVALQGIHLLLVPCDIHEPSEIEYTMLSRAAEHRVCIIAASHEKSFSKPPLIDNTQDKFITTANRNRTKAEKSTGVIANLVMDYAVLPQWTPRKCNHFINQPLVKYQHGKITKAVIHPMAAGIK